RSASPSPSAWWRAAIPPHGPHGSIPSRRFAMINALTRCCSFACAFTASVLAQAQAPAHDHAAAGPPATLMTGLGTHHHAIATKSPEAQRFFDQGLTLLYG